MAPEELEQIRSMFKDHIAGFIAIHDSKYEIIDMKLDLIKEQTTKHNGRMTVIEAKVTDLEKKDIQHISNCPNTARIRMIEDNQLKQSSVRRWIVASIGIVGGVLTGIWIFIQIQKSWPF